MPKQPGGITKFERIQAVKAVLGSKTMVRREFHVVAVLAETEYRELKRRARSQGRAVDQVVTNVVRAWLDDQDPDA